jgi:crotonobetainyl-CoA:carnitine CoA-transferase CaiB-like acyl-CoA transferase
MDLLRGISVLDASNVLAGPLCTYLLALTGARIVKIERPARGDPARSLGPDPERNARLTGLSFLAQNAGKESVTLDLTHPQGQALFRRLALRADVVVENYQPGVMRGWGLGPEALRAADARLVYCSISGFGQDGPWAARPAYDHIIQGLAGGMTLTGEPEGGPMKAGFPFCDTAAAMMAAFAIAAALMRRERTGEGAFLDVAMLDTALFTLGWPVGHFLTTGAMPPPMGNHNFTGSPSGTFRTADGLLNLTTNTQAQFLLLADLLGRPEWCSDPRFALPAARIAHRASLTTALEAVLSQRPAADWEALCAARDIPAARVRTIAEILAEQQVRLRGFVQHVKAGLDGEADLAVPTAGFRLDGAALGLRSPPPALGAATDAVLGELGVGAAELARLRGDAVI